MPEIAGPFFPNQAFAWAWCGVLLVFLFVGAAIDLRRHVVPKWVSLTTLALGVTWNVARGTWLGSQGLETWILGTHGPGVGSADGFLFSLAGFLTGFGVFLFMFAAGACRGGDVKIFAAMSAWVGPVMSLWIMVLSTIVLIVLLAFNVGAFAIPQSPQVPKPRPVDKNVKAPLARDPRSARGVTYALPLALATALALLWFLREELGLL